MGLLEKLLASRGAIALADIPPAATNGWVMTTLGNATAWAAPSGGGGASLAGSAPPAIGAASSTGVATTSARGDHSHAGVASINALTGAVSLAAGSNVTFTPSGNTITISASGGGSVPAGTGLRKVSGGVETIGLITSADITDGTIVNADVSASAGLAPTKLAAGSAPGQALGYTTSIGSSTATGNAFCAPNLIAVADVTFGSSGNVDVTLLTVPAGARYLIYAVHAELITALSGTGSVALTAGKTTGGQEYLKSQAVTSGTAANGKVFGNLVAEQGASLPTDGTLADDIGAATVVSCRAATTGTVTAGVARFYLFGVPYP